MDATCYALPRKQRLLVLLAQDLVPRHEMMACDVDQQGDLVEVLKLKLRAHGVNDLGGRGGVQGGQHEQSSRKRGVQRRCKPNQQPVHDTHLVRTGGHLVGEDDDAAPNVLFLELLQEFAHRAHTDIALVAEVDENLLRSIIAVRGVKVQAVAVDRTCASQKHVAELLQRDVDLVVGHDVALREARRKGKGGDCAKVNGHARTADMCLQSSPTDHSPDRAPARGPCD